MSWMGVVEWVWRICMDPMGTERWALFVKWVWKEFEEREKVIMGNGFDGCMHGA